MHIKQHKRFGGICICSVIMLAHGKLKFLSGPPHSLPPARPPPPLPTKPPHLVLNKRALGANGNGSLRSKKTKRREDERKEWKEKTAGPWRPLHVPQWGKGLSHNQERLFSPKHLVGSKKKIVPMNFLPQTSISTACTLEWLSVCYSSRPGVDNYSRTRSSQPPVFVPPLK